MSPDSTRAAKRARTLAIVASFVLVLTVATVTIGTTVTQQAENATEDGWPPETDDYDDPVINYDRVDLRLDITAANDSTIDYELQILGAIEPTNETADGTVTCREQLCLVDGAVGPNETASYNLSGVVLGTRPATNLTTAINGTLEGDAPVGLGLGAVSENETGGNGSDSGTTDGGVSDGGGSIGAALPNETEFPDPDENGAGPSDETGATPYLVTFVTTADANRADYAFRVDGTVSPYQGSEYESPAGNVVRSVSNYNVDQSDDQVAVSGHTANGFGDAYHVRGPVSSVDIADENEMWIEVNGTPVTPAELQAVTAGELDLDEATGPPNLPPRTPPEPPEVSLEVTDLNVRNVQPVNEHFVLENTGSDAVDLTGWTVRDRMNGGLVDAETLYPFEFPDEFTLGPDEQVSIHSGQGEDTATELYWGVDRNIWHDDGDTIILVSPDGGVAVKEPYGGGAPDAGGGNDDNGSTDPDDGENSSGGGDGGNGTGSAVSISYEDCSTVTVDGGDDDATYEYEFGTTFYVTSGIDTMIFEPDEQPPFTLDANERDTGAVTDVTVDSVAVFDADTGEEVAHETNPDDDECAELIAQQYEDWQADQPTNGTEDGETSDGSASGEEDRETTTADEEESDGEEGSGVEEESDDEGGSDGAGDEETSEGAGDEEDDETAEGDDEETTDGDEEESGTEEDEEPSGTGDGEEADDEENEESASTTEGDDVAETDSDDGDAENSDSSDNETETLAVPAATASRASM